MKRPRFFNPGSPGGYKPADLRKLSPAARGCNPSHHGYMINPASGRALICMWADCELRGQNKYHVDVLDPDGIHHLIFCGPFHKSLFVHSHRDMGKVAPGEKPGM
jgi:hypothetical protein